MHSYAATSSPLTADRPVRSTTFDESGERLLTTVAAANRLGITPRALRYKYANREIPAFRVGKLLLFRVRDVESYRRSRAGRHREVRL